MTPTVLVVAKAPIAGHAKTRLTPALTATDAATVAAAALLDTLDSVSRCTATHRIVALTGDLTRAECSREVRTALRNFTVVPQRGGSFGERLANAHADAARFGAPVLQIGMDTPQLTPSMLDEATQLLHTTGDALLGPAADGGWWALGLPSPQPARMLADIAMSTSTTGRCTRDALQYCGYRVRLLPTMTDADTIDDARRVAVQCTGRFSTTIRRLVESSANPAN